MEDKDRRIAELESHVDDLVGQLDACRDVLLELKTAQETVALYEHTLNTIQQAAADVL